MYKPLTALKRINFRQWLVLAVCLGLVIIGGLGGALLQSQLAEDDGLGSERRIVTREGRLINSIASSVGPSVVSVNAAVTEESSFFGDGRTAQAAGTGIIISKDGYVMTNRHVVPEGSSRVSVTLSDGTELRDVEVVGRTTADDNLDIAFLKINDTKGHQLKPAAVGDSSKVEVGDTVVAIGNALGQFQNTVTSGIISGYGRNVEAGSDSGSGTESLNDLFQTDAAINEGNSGGPLVNLNSEVIGINTAVAGEGAENIGFAIPTNDIRGMIKQVLSEGKFARPYIGVRYIALTPDIASEFDLKVRQGAFIVPSQDEFNSSVIPSGPADKAGIKEKDVIVAVNGKKVDQRHGLTSLLGIYKPGEKVLLDINRDGHNLKIRVELEARQ